MNHVYHLFRHFFLYCTFVLKKLGMRRQRNYDSCVFAELVEKKKPNLPVIYMQSQVADRLLTSCTKWFGQVYLAVTSASLKKDWSQWSTCRICWAAVHKQITRTQNETHFYASKRSVSLEWRLCLSNTPPPPSTPNIILQILDSMASSCSRWYLFNCEKSHEHFGCDVTICDCRRETSAVISLHSNEDFSHKDKLG